MENLEFFRVFENGSVSVIELYIDRTTNFLFAKKIIDNNKLTQEKKKKIDNEIKIITKLNNPFIIKYHDFKENFKNYIITMEFFSGRTVLYCLKEYINKYKKPFPEKIVRHIIQNIIKGLTFLHENNIILNDLTNDSIFVKFYKEKDIKQLNMLQTHIKIGRLKNAIKVENSNNNIFYNNNKIDLLYEKSKDIYSLGEICSELLFGAIIRNKQEYINLNNNKQIDYTIPSNLSSQIIDFLRMLRYATINRVTIDKVSAHPFLKDNIEIFDFVEIDDILNKNKINIISIKNNDDKLHTSSMFSKFSQVSEKISKDNKNNKLRIMKISPSPTQKNIKNINQNYKKPQHNSSIYINNPSQTNQIINLDNSSQQNQSINLNKNKNIFEISHSSLYSDNSSIINNSSSRMFSFAGTNSSINNNQNIINFNNNQSSQNINNNSIQTSNYYQNLSLNKSNLKNIEFYNNNLHYSYNPKINMNNNLNRKFFGSNNYNGIKNNISPY